MIGFYKTSVIGTSHLSNPGGVCQDASGASNLDNGWVVSCIADGLGSSLHSDIASSCAVSTCISYVCDNLKDPSGDEEIGSVLKNAFSKAASEIQKIADENNAPISDYDTTLTLSVYDGKKIWYEHVGDGGIITLSEDGTFKVLTKAQKGENFNETTPLRAGENYWFFGTSESDICSYAMMTDGIFDVACPWLLSMTEQPVYINYIRSFIDNNMLKMTSQDEFDTVEKEISAFLSSDDCLGITDDKTIVGVINTDLVSVVRDEAYYSEPDFKSLSEEYKKKLYEKNEPLDETEIFAEEDPDK